jgi:hypothetical protein
VVATKDYLQRRLLHNDVMLLEEEDILLTKWSGKTLLLKYPLNNYDSRNILWLGRKFLEGTKLSALDDYKEKFPLPNFQPKGSWSLWKGVLPPTTIVK